MPNCAFFELRILFPSSSRLYVEMYRASSNLIWGGRLGEARCRPPIGYGRETTRTDTTRPAGRGGEPASFPFPSWHRRTTRRPLLASCGPPLRSAARPAGRGPPVATGRSWSSRGRRQLARAHLRGDRAPGHAPALDVQQARARWIGVDYY
jgi:hypothetical protein